jgi:hypothetical protein
VAKRWPRRMRWEKLGAAREKMRKGHRGLNPLGSFACIDLSSKRGVTHPKVLGLGQSATHEERTSAAWHIFYNTSEKGREVPKDAPAQVPKPPQDQPSLLPRTSENSPSTRLGE